MNQSRLFLLMELFRGRLFHASFSHVFLEIEAGGTALMRRLVTGDIHGCRQELLELLSRFGPEPDDEIIAIGDVIDRVFLLDTGRCYGKALTGIILPEFRLISVPSRRNYWGIAVQQSRTQGGPQEKRNP